DVPGQAVERVTDAIGVPDAAEVIVRRDPRRCHARIERLERVQRGEFGYPRVAQLAKVGRGVAGKCGEELLVRRAPRQLLHLDANARMRPLELWHELRDDLALAAHRPEAH